MLLKKSERCPITRISLATAGLFVSDDASSDEKEEKQMYGLGAGPVNGLGAGPVQLEQLRLGAGLMQLEKLCGELTILPQPPSLTCETYSPRQFKPVSSLESSTVVAATGPLGPLGFCPMLAIPASVSSCRSVPGPMHSGGTSRAASPAFSESFFPERRTMNGSRPPSALGSHVGTSRGNSRAASPSFAEPYIPERSRTSFMSSCSDGLTMVSKDIALLRMLQQGIGLVGEHMSARINRRLDHAQTRVRALEITISSLRSALSQDAKCSHSRDTAFHRAGGAHKCVPDTMDSRNGSPNQASGANSPLARTSDSSAALARHATQATDTAHVEKEKEKEEPKNAKATSRARITQAPPNPPAPQQDVKTQVWGGGLVEIECHNAESGEPLCQLCVPVSGTWDQVRQALVTALRAVTPRAVEEGSFRFSDSGGGSIALTTESSWVLCKALRSLNTASRVTSIACLFAAPTQAEKEKREGDATAVAVLKRRVEAAAAAAAAALAPHALSTRSSKVVSSGSSKASCSSKVGVSVTPSAGTPCAPHLDAGSPAGGGGWSRSGGRGGGGGTPAVSSERERASDTPLLPHICERSRREHTHTLTDGAHPLHAKSLQLAVAAGGVRPASSSSSRFASKKSYEVEMGSSSSGHHVIFKTLLYSNRHPFTIKLNLERMECEDEDDEGRRAAAAAVKLEFQSTCLVLAPNQEASIPVKIGTRRLSEGGGYVASQGHNKLKVHVAVKAVGIGAGQHLELMPDLIELLISSK